VAYLKEGIVNLLAIVIEEHPAFTRLDSKHAEAHPATASIATGQHEKKVGHRALRHSATRIAYQRPSLLLSPLRLKEN
jgi:hypothetical protein